MKEIIDLTKEVGEEKMTRRTFIVGSVVAVAALLSSDEVLAEEPTPRVLILEESESMYGPWTEVTGWDGFLQSYSKRGQE